MLNADNTPNMTPRRALDRLAYGALFTCGSMLTSMPVTWAMGGTVSNYLDNMLAIALVGAIVTLWRAGSDLAKMD